MAARNVWTMFVAAMPLTALQRSHKTVCNRFMKNQNQVELPLHEK